MSPHKILRTLGLVLHIYAVFMATSLFWVLLEEDRWEQLQGWGAALAITLGSGVLAVLFGGGGRRLRDADGGIRVDAIADPLREGITRRESLWIVTLSWLAAGVFGGLPFLLCGMVDSPVDAFFEAVSGITTTGSTILTDIEGQSRALLWWRSLIQWVGGMGIIVLFVAVLPMVGAGGRRLFQSEAPGPVKDQLRPRIRETGAALWRIYAGLTFALFVLLMALGMTAYDALCHAFTTMATGGFSTKNASIAGFGHAGIEAVVTVFMLLAGTNFAIFYAISRRRAHGFHKDAELRAYLLIVALATVLVTLSLQLQEPGGVVRDFRRAAFQVVSIVTSTGFGTDDFDLYPSFSRGLLVFLMFVGGMGGSTAGGFKVSRALICLKAAIQEVRHVLHPRAVFAVHLAGRPVDHRVVQSALAMGVLAAAVLGGGTLLLAEMGLALETAFSAAMTATFNCGPGLNELGPVGNFAGVPALGKLLLAGMMILGRLEFFTVLALFLPRRARGM